jgi:hypothetical protein
METSLTIGAHPLLECLSTRTWSTKVRVDLDARTLKEGGSAAHTGAVAYCSLRCVAVRIRMFTSQKE